MINLAWGGYSNGRLPLSALVQVTSKPDYLEYSTSVAWAHMQKDCAAATGKWITIAPGSSAYRDYTQQVYFYNQYIHNHGNVAAVPGTSNHGWGRAIDITGYESSDAVWNWLLANAGKYGFSWQTGRASGERWHWESLNPPQNPPANTASSGAKPLEEDDMKLTAIRNYDGSLGIIGPDGLLYPISDITTWSSYLRLGIVQQQPNGSFYLQQTDGTVWNALTRHTKKFS
jgi:hypothetical protein